MQIQNLPIQKIKPDKNQPRQTLDEDKIQGMALSIATEGVINPVEIDKNYIIVTGEMRWRAAKVAGLKEIPCKIISIKPQERFRRQVIENVHHNTMTDGDTARALAKLLNLFPGNRLAGKDAGIAKLAKEIGKGRHYIQEHLDILEASTPIQKAIETGRIPYTHIRAIKSTPDQYKKEIEQKVLQGEFKTRDAALEVVAAINRDPTKAREILKVNYTPFETTQEVIEKVAKISPRLSDKIRESYNPVNELSSIIDNLTEWLKQNPPSTIGLLHAPRIVINLSAAVANINEWGRKVKQLRQLKGN